jgi:hypothetical protein
MPRAKSIRIYLADGSPSGIRHGEIFNWSGQALACPRARFGELKSWAEAQRPGVYFLFGVDDETGRDAVYIGEAEVVADRVNSHLTGKEFWTDVIIFTSKDDNLTKGHVRYLEARLVELAEDAGRYALKNGNSPGMPALPRADRDAMEEFIEFIRPLIGVLGHRALDTLAPRKAPMFGSDAATPLVDSSEMSTSPAKNHSNFILRIGSMNASAIRTDEGIVVLSGSDANTNPQPSLSAGYRLRYQQLIDSSVLVPNGGKYKFAKDYLFPSPSQAAAVIVGYSVNGRDAWKTSSGRTWAEIEEAEVTAESTGTLGNFLIESIGPEKVS